MDNQSAKERKKPFAELSRALEGCIRPMGFACAALALIFSTAGHAEPKYYTPKDGQDCRAGYQMGEDGDCYVQKKARASTAGDAAPGGKVAAAKAPASTTRGSTEPEFNSPRNGERCHTGYRMNEAGDCSPARVAAESRPTAPQDGASRTRLSAEEQESTASSSGMATVEKSLDVIKDVQRLKGRFGF